MPDRDGTRRDLRICVRFYNIIADQVGKREEVCWVVGASVISDLLHMLTVQYPALHRYVAAADRASAPSSPGPLRLFRNGRIVVDTTEPLADGDEIRIFPIISGG